MAGFLTGKLYDTLVDSVQRQFIDEEKSPELNAGIDIVQGFLKIYVDENPDNKTQLRDYLIRLGQAASSEATFN